MSNKLTRRNKRKTGREHPYACACCGGDSSQEPWMAINHPTGGFVGVQLKMELHTEESLERAILRAVIDSGLLHAFDHTTAFTVLHEDGCELHSEGRCCCGPKVVPRVVFEAWDGEPEAATLN